MCSRVGIEVAVVLVSSVSQHEAAGHVIPSPHTGVLEAESLHRGAGKENHLSQNQTKRDAKRTAAGPWKGRTEGGRLRTNQASAGAVLGVRDRCDTLQHAVGGDRHLCIVNED